MSSNTPTASPHTTTISPNPKPATTIPAQGQTFCANWENGNSNLEDEQYGRTISLRPPPPTPAFTPDRSASPQTTLHFPPNPAIVPTANPTYNHAYSSPLPTLLCTSQCTAWMTQEYWVGFTGLDGRIGGDSSFIADVGEGFRKEHTSVKGPGMTEDNTCLGCHFHPLLPNMAPTCPPFVAPLFYATTAPAADPLPAIHTKTFRSRPRPPSPTMALEALRKRQKRMGEEGDELRAREAARKRAWRAGRGPEDRAKEAKRKRDARKRIVAEKLGAGGGTGGMIGNGGDLSGEGVLL